MGTFLLLIIVMGGSAFLWAIIDFEPTLYDGEYKHKQWEMRQKAREKAREETRKSRNKY